MSFLETSDVSGVAIVKFDESFLSEVEDDLNSNRVITKSTDFNQLNDCLGITSLERMFPYAGKFEERTRAEGLHKWYIVNYNPNISFTRASESFGGFKGIEVVEPKRPVIINDCFDDPWLAKQWHYNNNGSLTPYHIYGADINVIPVWERYTTGNSDVVVAVVDGGIDQNHIDLATNCIGGYNFVNKTSTITPHDHGTHVAGTIAAINNNGIGVSGIAGGNYAKGEKGISLLSCQIFQNASGGDYGSTAIKWAADNGAVIAQNSWGYDYESYSEAKLKKLPQYLKEAIDYFIKYAGVDENGEQVGPMKGGVVIFAAGNDGWDTNPIGQYSPVISVGAFGADGRKTYYSNYGDWVDISAPGGDSKGNVISTLPNNQYGGMTGTSMACPHVSGVAALLISYFGGPGFTAAELERKLIGGANKSFTDSKLIGPAVDALGSMTFGNVIAPDPVSDLSVQVINNHLHFEWSVTADEDDIKAYGYRLFISKQPFDFVNRVADSIEVMTKNLNVGDKLSADYSKIQLGNRYYASIVAFDRSNNLSPMSETITVKLPENRPPVINPLQEIPQDIKVGAHDSLSFLFEISDPDGHNYNVSLRDAISSSGLIKRSEDLYSITIYGNSKLRGVYQAKIVVFDEYGASSDFKMNYELLQNFPPVLIGGIQDTILDSMDKHIVFNLKEYFMDPDGGKLEYQFFSSNPSIMIVNQKYDEVSLIPIDYGSTEFVATASDSYGASAEMRFKVAVRNGSDVLVYPNPVSDYLNISVPQSDKARIKIITQTGNTELDKTYVLDPFNNKKIDMRNFSAGIYYLSIKGETINLEKQIIKK